MMCKYSVTATVNCDGFVMKVSFSKNIHFTDVDNNNIWDMLYQVSQRIIHQYKAENVFMVTETLSEYNNNGKLIGRRSVVTYPANNVEEL